jgi:Lrp/AsnC family transcriptional regulator
MDSPVKLDEKDKKILRALAVNARTSRTQIAKSVRLSADAVDYRINKLQEKNVIRRFYANVNFEQLGYYLFHVFFLLDESKQEQHEQFLLFLKEHSNVVSVIEYNDRWDLEAAIVAKSLRDFDEVLLAISSLFPGLILEKDKVEIIKRFHSKSFPGQSTILLPRENHVPSLDEKDYAILRIITDDCRVSTYAIGEKVGLSADAVRNRIKGYLETGLVTNCTILANISAIGMHWFTLSVQLTNLDREQERRFEEFLRQHPEVIRAVKTLGGWDVLLYVVVEKAQHYHMFVKELKRTFSTIVRNYETWMGLHEYVYKPMPPVMFPKP